MKYDLDGRAPRQLFVAGPVFSVADEMQLQFRRNHLAQRLQQRREVVVLVHAAHVEHDGHALRQSQFGARLGHGARVKHRMVHAERHDRNSIGCDPARGDQGRFQL